MDFNLAIKVDSPTFLTNKSTFEEKKIKDGIDQITFV